MSDHQKENRGKEKSPEVRAAEEAVEKAKLKLAKVRKSETTARRKRRDTAIFTIGAMFDDLFNRDEEKAKAVYQELLDGVNAKLFYDNRRVALKHHFKFQSPERPQEDGYDQEAG